MATPFLPQDQLFILRHPSLQSTVIRYLSIYLLNSTKNSIGLSMRSSKTILLHKNSFPLAWAFGITFNPLTEFFPLPAGTLNTLIKPMSFQAICWRTDQKSSLEIPLSSITISIQFNIPMYATKHAAGTNETKMINPTRGPSRRTANIVRNKKVTISNAIHMQNPYSLGNLNFMCNSYCRLMYIAYQSTVIIGMRLWSHAMSRIWIQ